EVVTHLTKAKINGVAWGVAMHPDGFVVAAMVGELLKGGPEALASAKQLVRLVEMMPQGGSIRAEATVGIIAERRASTEGREGIGAFLEKRRPAWIGG
ncbi:MAG: hypothetical protein WAS21_21630, partial [Geminicoccaceae bacterium]